MNKQTITELKPFLSVVLIVASLFSLVFMKMEVRSKGYMILSLSRQEKKMRDHQREQMVALAKYTRPDRVQTFAQTKLTLRKAEVGQIIQMTAQNGTAIRQ